MTRGGGSGGKNIRSRSASHHCRSASQPHSKKQPPSVPTSQPLPPPKFKYRRTSGEVWRCKKGKRTDIKPSEWDKYRYVDKPEVLQRPLSAYGPQAEPIRRIKRRDITPQWFYENVASKNEPFIIEDCMEDWPAMQNWCIDALEERFRHVAFKVAKDDKGKKLRTKFKYYADYVRNQQDDSPLYLFETNVDDNASIRPLVDDFEVPDIFPHDWMSLVNSDARPPFRWFCIGPKRSGTTVHTDPLGTHAWNAVTHGTKRWVVMDPKESKKVVKGRDLLRSGEDDEAIMYFDFLLPRILHANPDLKVFMADQGPGSVIFVPGEWWHAVVNLEDTVAVTQNYCGPENFSLVWRKIRKEREKVAYLWLRNMRKFAPELYEKALRMNRKDGFRMRHERPEGERLSSCSSSSSESSSDSSTDEAADLDPGGLGTVLRRGVKLGSDAFRLQRRRGRNRGSPPGLTGSVRACLPSGTWEERMRGAAQAGKAP